MKVGRALPPAAAPLRLEDLWNGLVGLFTPARRIAALEEELRREFGQRHVFLVSSGTAALTLSLQALRARSDRRDVVLPAYTCFSVPAAVVEAGLRPVLCDVDPATFDFNHEQLARVVGPNTLCAVAHHLFGVPSDVARTRALCNKRGIYLVEDAAQAMGAECNGRRLGTIGDIGIFSLGRGKNITCGSGGIIVTNRDDLGAALAERYRRVLRPSRTAVLRELLRVVFMMVFIHPRLFWIPAALPFLRLGETIFPDTIRVRRLSGLQAGLLSNWRKRLAASNAARARTVTFFTECLPAATQQRRPGPYVRLPLFAASPVSRARIQAKSRTRGLGIAPGYPTPVNEIPQIRAAFEGQHFPVAATLATTLLTVPTHHWLSDDDKREIVTVCRDLARA